MQVKIIEINICGCVNTNRSFIGIESDETYFNIAKNRIEQTGLQV